MMKRSTDMVVKQSSKNNGTRIFFKNAITTLLFTAPLSASVFAASNATVIDNGAAETVPGSQTSPWILPGAIYAGVNSTGSLTITTGGVVRSSTTTSGTNGSVLGYNSGSAGTITVDGGAWYDGVDPSNQALSNGTTAVGGGGTGTLKVLNGGKVGLVFMNVGQNDNSTGTVVVDGAGSQLLATVTPSSGITVGTSGTGSVTISNGGSIISNSATTVGWGKNANGTVNVDGSGSSWVINSGPMIVGGAGTGSMSITNGGVVKSAGGSIAGGSPADDAAGKGDVTIDGPGSLWDIGARELNIGTQNSATKLPSGNGTLVVSNQGQLNAQSIYINAENGTVAIGALAGQTAAAAGTINAKKITLANTNSNLVFNHTDTSGNYVFSPKIGGLGNVSQLSGITVINNVNSYTGTTTIDGGALIVGDAANPTAVLNGATAADVTVGSNGLLAGTGLVNGLVVNNGTVAAYNTLNGQESQPNSNFTLAGGIDNKGTINLAGAQPGNTLTVGNKYTGDNGTLILKTYMGDDSSASDRLVLNNAKADGNTDLVIKHGGGTGARTNTGILLVDAQNGSTTTPDAFRLSPSSDGYRQNIGTIAAGAYDYSLTRGGDGTAGNPDSWYLTSREVKPMTPLTPSTPPTDQGNQPPVGPKTQPDPATTSAPVLRPEIGSYIDNLRAANTIFTMRLHDRLGETQYLDDMSGNGKVSSMWMRNIGGHTGSHVGNDAIATQANRYVMQVGGDIADWSNDGLDRYLVGLMGGYANQKSHSVSHASGYNSRGSLNGYSVGVYGTWYANDTTKQGTYVDTWALYNWFNNSVSGEGLPSESYKSNGFTASVEAGYTHKTGEYQTLNGMVNQVFIQPKAQITWMGVKADNHTEINGTDVSGTGDNNIQTRLGVRAFIKGQSKLDEGSQREFEPFVEANWIYNTDNYGVNMDGVRTSMDGARNIGELKLGVEGKINRQATLWANVAQQIGDKGYSDTQGTVGVKYAF
ncbi:putative autotransporter protein [Yokenella regensburgei ATCC 49455]|nr:putative autotransporter protein [Yokenella regensburgei ATCC 49455]